jgi:hypothetical protein
MSVLNGGRHKAPNTTKATTAAMSSGVLTGIMSKRTAARRGIKRLQTHGTIGQHTANNPIMSFFIIISSEKDLRPQGSDLRPFSSFPGAATAP